MSFNTVYALEFSGFTLLGVALDQTWVRVRAWWYARRSQNPPSVSTTTYWASMFLLLTLISIAFQASSRIQADRDRAAEAAHTKRAVSCLTDVIGYNFGLINSRSKLQKNVSDAQKAFYLDLYNALLHPIDPNDKKARDAQRKNFTADTTAVVKAQTAIDKARDTRPYRTGKNCVE